MLLPVSNFSSDHCCSTRTKWPEILALYIRQFGGKRFLSHRYLYGSLSLSLSLNNNTVGFITALNDIGMFLLSNILLLGADGGFEFSSPCTFTKRWEVKFFFLKKECYNYELVMGILLGRRNKPFPNLTRPIVGIWRRNLRLDHFSTRQQPGRAATQPGCFLNSFPKCNLVPKWKCSAEFFSCFCQSSWCASMRQLTFAAHVMTFNFF
mmetsp:Transcript_23765/g.36069  ORF Transcript_23765/g.36069 Transcript_23765/m.36069 type:complete len:208 (+) Transcript_23765:137-760(+)